MKAFKVKGTFQMGDRWQQFTKEVVGSDEEAVKEQVYSRLGSKHRVKRAKIHISDVKEISLEEVSDPITKYMIEKGKVIEKEKIKKGEKNE